MMRLIEEVTKRCAAVAQQKGVRTCAMSALYGGKGYSVAVLAGTAAVQMTTAKLGEELLALLGSGLTEEGLSTLLNRWSQPLPRAGSFSASSSTAAAPNVFTFGASAGGGGGAAGGSGSSHGLSMAESNATLVAARRIRKPT